jgi:hypothetical protein
MPASRPAVLTRMIYNEFKLRLPGAAADADATRTACPPRSRRAWPFLDHEQVEFTMDIPKPRKVKELQCEASAEKACASGFPDEIIESQEDGLRSPDVAMAARASSVAASRRDLLRSAAAQLRVAAVRLRAELCRAHREGRHDNRLYVWAPVSKSRRPWPRLLGRLRCARMMPALRQNRRVLRKPHVHRAASLDRDPSRARSAFRSRRARKLDRRLASTTAGASDWKQREARDARQSRGRPSI